MAKELELQFNGMNHAELLPMEILIKIFQHLNPMDRYEASHVCKRMLEASEHFYFVDDTQLNFNKVTFSDNFSPAKDFLTSFRSFPNIQLTEVEVADCDCFFQKHGIEIECLSIISCDISEKKLSSILQAIPNVTSLKIQKCSDLFISGRLLSDTLSSFTMENVKILSLAENRHLTDLLFNRITSLMPNLSSLDLSSNTISFHKGLFKKYYPGNHDEELSGSKTVLTLHYIQKFLKRRAEKIKTLNFNSTLIDGTALQSLADIENLQLESLFLRSCEQLTNEGIVSLVSVQTSLKVLDLSCTARLTDVSLIHICENLKNLRVLKIRRCHALTDISVKMISDLPFLEILDISECKSLTSQSIIEGIASRLNELLIELYLSALNLSNPALIKVAENIPNLRVLDLSYCINHVDDVCLQMVLKNLTMLRELNLNFCERISDAGLTGMSMDNQITQYELSINKEVHEQNSEANVSGNNYYSHKLIKRPIRISLKSKAEEEIVEDALRKRAMLQLAKEINLREQPCSSFSMACLKGLRVLRLGGCNKVTDVSLIYNFKLPELKEINLSRCQQISLQGITELVKSCPALEIVNLSECHNVDDKCIELITRKLPRLAKLDISRCYKLTDFSLDYIAINCKRIRILNVAGCKNMSDEPHLKLINIETLRDVSMNKRGSEVENSNKIPRPPMLSSLFKH